MTQQKHPTYRCAAWCLLTIVTLAASVPAWAQSNSWACGDLKSHYGPFDYRTSRGERLDTVERYHFTPEVEALIRGKSSIHIGQDLGYTLGTFPNHHRALMSTMLYGRKLKSPQPPDLKYSVECFFQRALRFRPDDTTARMIYAMFLTANDRAPEAMRELERVEKEAGDNPFTSYNLGLIYLDLREYNKALQLAHKAMAQGFVQTGLRDRLQLAGKWQDPEERPTAVK